MPARYGTVRGAGSARRRTARRARSPIRCRCRTRRRAARDPARAPAAARRARRCGRPPRSRWSRPSSDNPRACPPS
nr:MAG: hypothetical protein DIU56_11505 [Pseudomonadota bacterium]